jgi:hypothetical protein
MPESSWVAGENPGSSNCSAKVKISLLAPRPAKLLVSTPLLRLSDLGAIRRPEAFDNFRLYHEIINIIPFGAA